VYGDHGDAWIDEDTIPIPGAIGMKQLACEQVATSAAREGLPCVVLRPCTVYGPMGPAVDFFFASAARGILRYPGSGTNFFPFVRDTDLAEAYALAIERRPVGQIISVGDDEPMRMRDVAGAVLQAFGGGKAKSVPRWLMAIVAGAPLAEMLTQSFRVRNARAKAILGWVPRYASLRVGLSDAVSAWIRGQPAAAS
jgi:nucleoside-diphosphate-sugar epimerase